MYSVETYNTGAQAVQELLAKIGTVHLDEFEDRSGYWEIGGYVKREMGSAGFPGLFLVTIATVFLLTGFIERTIVRLVEAYEEGGIRECRKNGTIRSSSSKITRFGCRITAG